jgi:dTDP-4-dehydrorhamnose reductase
MRVLLIGKRGQLGWELARCLGTLGELTALGSAELDLTRSDAIRETLRRLKPDVVVNAAAYTDVEGAETEPELAKSVNAVAPGVLAQVACDLGAGLVHYSTDYVFDGVKDAPYDEDDLPAPINAYGRSKLEGERAIQRVGGSHVILRTSWLYGIRGYGFPRQVLEWSRSQTVMRVVKDRRGSPTWSRMLAQATAMMLFAGGPSGPAWPAGREGVYHLAGTGSTSRYAWAQAVVALDPRKDEQIVERIVPASSNEFPTTARRPANSALSCARFEAAFGLSLPGWEAALALAMEESA